MKIIEGFPIQEGLHCSSTSLSEIMKYNGYNLSEAMVFGISSGLDFVYLNQRFEICPRFIFTRTPMLEKDFFENIGMEFKWQASIYPEWDIIKKNIDHNNPVLFLTDPSKLDFFEVTTPSAAGHTLTVIGYNNIDRTLYISDSISSELIECKYENLLDSINIGKVPFNKPDLWASIPEIHLTHSLDSIIVNAIKKNAFQFLDSSNDARGISAINRLAEEVEYWIDLPNYRFICSHVYSSIELIGTGGSGFRKLYTNFLGEINDYIYSFDANTYIEAMKEISRLYRNLAKCFYLESLGRSKSYIPKIKDCLYELEESETKFWESIILELCN